MENIHADTLVAPCGINCGYCFAYLQKNKCTGCRGSDFKKPVTRISCKIKTCNVFQKGKATFCFECEKFPCKNLTHIDTRYKIKYNVSLIGSLEYIKNNGIRKFIKRETEKWKCAECGEPICLHSNICSSCGYIRGNVTNIMI